MPDQPTPTAVADDRAISATERSELSKLLVARTITAIGILLGVTFVLLAGTLIAVIWKFDANPEKANHLLEKTIAVFDKVISSFFPLVGAWVGAVVAFYFARDNFISATQSVETLLNRGEARTQNRKAVSTEMTPIAKAFKKSGTVDDLKKTPLGTLLGEMATAGVGRVVLLEVEKPYAVLHASCLEKIILDKQLDRTTATLDVILSDNSYSPLLSSTFALVKSTATIAEANTALNAQAAQVSGGVLGCSDVLVTATGKMEEQVVGYLTNDDIRKAMTSVS